MIDATYIDHCGTDLSVVNAARVSFGKKSELVEVDGYLTLKDADVRLINYLAKHKHYSPFGHAFASFHVKAPIFVARQLVKHKFLRWNEISRRYVDDPPEFYNPEVWRGKSEDKKQGSQGAVDIYDVVMYENGGIIGPWTLGEEMQEHFDRSMEQYNLLLTSGVAPEMARMVLPQSMMTEWYWSGSLDAFADMCKLRCKSDTQYETRIVADKISVVMRDLFPHSWDALLDVAEVATTVKQEPNLLIKLDNYNGWEYYNEGTE
jgi:thymidylate synthase (FAD)